MAGCFLAEINRDIMTINAHTKIGALLKQNPEALDAIVSLSPKFIKLRNPVLRKVIAGRTSIATASRLGGCSVEDFFNKLQPLGFEIDRTSTIQEATGISSVMPDFLKNCPADQITELDVRPLIESGKDPLDIILHKLKALESGKVLMIVNSFEPTPLILLLSKKGFKSFTDTISNDLVHTFFYKDSEAPLVLDANESMQSPEGKPETWAELLDRYKGRLETIDVRSLPMPLPMHTILEALENLPMDKALFVYHKRIPVFLLPELNERKLSYRINEISEAEVELLIYKEQHA